MYMAGGAQVMISSPCTAAPQIILWIYDLTAGNDLATILGGGGYSALTINKNATRILP